ncbi:MAG: GGDEF domain-containing protein [Xanthomonadaceae bacterium]|nr:GGDEF domain-containing protein [Xanthomonadaceae bacterium]
MSLPTPVLLAPAARPQAIPAAAPVPVVPVQAHAEAPANPPSRSLPWLLLLALAGALLAWWASLRRSRQLREEAERLARQQRFLKSAHNHLRQKSEQLQQLSMHDPLTGTLNRQAFAAELRERIDHLARYNQPLSLIVFDLDHFKAINDSHGHLVGDTALALVVGVVREHLVSDDLFGRFGGDEFMIACAGQHAAGTVALAERLRAAVAERAPLAVPPIPGLTLSLGVAQADPDHEGSRMLTTPPARGVESERAACGPRAATSAITRSEADVRRRMASCLNL